MNLLELAPHLGLALLILAVAWRVVFAPHRLEAILVYIGFGLLVSLAWVFLRAPDVALAEAAIGAGITGALLLSALTAARRGVPGGRAGRVRFSPLLRWGAAPAVLAGGAVLGWAVWAAVANGPGLGPAALSRLAESGVENPVTAVLLNYRAYDTLLELVVLLIAAVAVFSASSRERAAGTDRSGPVINALLRVLPPLMIVLAFYLVWVGGKDPGGAFQGGAVLAAAAVLALLITGSRAAAMPAAAARPVLVAGVLVFLLAAGVTAVGGDPLGYRGAEAKWVILVIEVAAAVSIGLTLAVLFRAGDRRS